MLAYGGTSVQGGSWDGVGGLGLGHVGVDVDGHCIKVELRCCALVGAGKDED
jgi:hypothetical protein